MRILTILFVAFATSVSAQTATNFTIDDIDGNTRGLFSELDNGNIVVLKFFTNWCSVCNNTADDVVAIYNGYQSNGDPVVFWALDRDQNETNVQATTYRDNHAIPFPVIGEAYSVAQQFGVVYQPEYYVVRPDRSYAKKTNYTAMQTEVNDALAALGTGISEIVAGYELKITDKVITWNAPVSETATLRVTDASGRLVVEQTLLGQEPVTLKNLQSGVYIYSLSHDNQVFKTGKIGYVK